MVRYFNQGVMCCLAVVFGLFLFSSVSASEPELEVESYPANHPQAQILWIPSEYGVLPEERLLAKKLAEKGVSVTILNLFESYFLPTAPSSLQKIPLQVITDKLAELQKQALPLWVVSANQGAALSVKALVQYQQAPKKMLGVILINPNLYIETPEVGQTAHYWDAVNQLNLPVFVMQAEMSPWRWRLAELQSQLQVGGASVFLKILPGVRDRYYFRPDALSNEQQLAQQLPQQILTSMQAIVPYLREARAASPILSQKAHSLLTSDAKITRPGNFEAKKLPLKPYRGVQNIALSAPDLSGVVHQLDAYRGKVVLLNFWASWCPPCVHEMPSMSRLKNALGSQPFEILAVNLAEPIAKIEAFVAEHPVNFPILLDPKGTAVKDWRVFAYPSSYVLDKAGNIRFALFGGHEWDEPDTVRQLQSLLEE